MSVLQEPLELHDQRKRLFLSIRPEYVAQILDGRKWYELRKVRPHLRAGDEVLIYCTLPESAIVGSFRVAAVLAAPPSVLWKRVREGSGVKPDHFRSYFADKAFGYAIEVARPHRFLNPLPLSAIRKHVPGFSPPQSFWYLSNNRRRDAALSNFVERAQRATV